MTLVVAIISGVIAVSIPAATAFAANDVTITAYGLRNTPQSGVNV